MRGVPNLRWQVSLGIIVHSCFGIKDGTNFVANRQVFCGFRSHTSSGTSTMETTCEWLCILEIMIDTIFDNNISAYCKTHFILYLLIVTLFWLLLCYTPSTTNLNRQLFTFGVTNKFAWLFFNVFRGTRRFVYGSALLWSLAIADLL